MAEKAGDGQTTGSADEEWAAPLARQHAAEAIASGRTWDCACVCCEAMRAAGWRPEHDRSGYPMEQRIADLVASKMVGNALRLWRMRGTHVGRKGIDIVSAAAWALAKPDDPAHAAEVERMYRALVGVDARRGDRLLMFEIERTVKAAQSWFYSVERDNAARHFRGDLAAIADRHDANAPVPDEAMLEELLTLLDKGKIETSGAVGRILATMGIGSAKGISEVTLTKRVCEAFRERDVRDGKKIVAKRGPRTKRLKSKAKR